MNNLLATQLSPLIIASISKKIAGKKVNKENSSTINAVKRRIIYISFFGLLLDITPAGGTL